MKRIILFLIITISSTLSEDVAIPNTSALTSNEASKSNLAELVKLQTDAIKKILAEAEHNKNVLPKIPPPAPLDEDVKDIRDPTQMKIENERKSIEELRLKCLGLFKETTTEKLLRTEIPFGPPIKPEFLKQRHNSGDLFIFGASPNGVTNAEAYKNNIKEIEENVEMEGETEAEANTEKDLSGVTVDYDYDDKPDKIDDKISSNEGETNSETPINVPNYPPEEKLKYVRIDSLVLQQMVLTTGRPLYYWFKPLQPYQSFIQIPDTPENKDVESVAKPENINYPIPPSYKYYIDPVSGDIMRNEAPKRPQFFLNPVTGQLYQYSGPNDLIYHQRREPDVTSTSTSTTTTTTTTTTPKPIMPEFNIEYPLPEEDILPDYPKDKYKHEYRFVMPMYVPPPQKTSNYPYEFDPYAYYPQNLRPDFMNIPVPYAPNYQMIKTLSVPNENVDKKS